MRWEDIQGQPETVQFLRQSRRKKRLTHAYLFAGPEGVGKSFTARVLAQVLNCRQGAENPCGECDSCLRIEHMSHPDVFRLLPSGISRSLTIDQIRQMQKAAHFSAQMGGWKIFIIEDADTMTESASNSLLKTLEEPPSQTMIIFITARPEEMSPTIRSRCQSIRFKPCSFELLEGFLQQKTGLSSDEIHILYHIAGGRPGRVLRMREDGFFTTRSLVLQTLHRPEFGTGRELVTRVDSWLGHLSKRRAKLEKALEKKRFSWGKDMEPDQIKAWEERDKAVLAVEARIDLALLFELVLTWFRDVYVFQTTGQEKYVINQDQINNIREQARQWSADRLVRSMRQVEQSRRAVLKQNAPPKLALEDLFLQLGFWQPN